VWKLLFQKRSGFPRGGIVGGMLRTRTACADRSSILEQIIRPRARARAKLAAEFISGGVGERIMQSLSRARACARARRR